MYKSTTTDEEPVYRSLPLGLSGGLSSAGTYDAEPAVYRSLAVFSGPASTPAYGTVDAYRSIAGLSLGADAVLLPARGETVSKGVPLIAPAAKSPPPPVTRVVQGAPVLPLPLELYPLSSTHAYTSAKSDLVVSRVSERLSGCEVDFKYNAAKMKWKCNAHNAKYAAVSFVVRVFEVPELPGPRRLLVEATRRSGCAMQWHSLYEHVFSALADVVEFDEAHTQSAERRRQAQERLAAAVAAHTATLPTLRSAQEAASLGFLGDALGAADAECREASARCLAQLSAEPHVAALLLPRVAEIAPLLAPTRSEETRSLGYAVVSNLLERGAGGAFASAAAQDAASPIPALARSACCALQGCGATSAQLAAEGGCSCSLESRERRREAARLCGGLALCWPGADAWECWRASVTLRELRASLGVAAASDDARLKARAAAALAALPR